MDALGPLILPASDISPNLTMNFSVVESKALFFGQPLVASVGILINVVNIVCVVKGQLVHQMLSPLVILLCVSDGGFLLILLLTWTGKHFVNIYQLTGVCQVAVFTSHMLGFLSSWMTVALVVMTLSCLIYPDRFSQMCSPTASRLLSCVFGVFIFAAYLYKTWTHGTIETIKGPFCTIIPENKSAMKILSTIDVLLIVFVPCMIISMVQIGIVIRAAHLRCKGTGVEGSCPESARDQETAAGRPYAPCNSGAQQDDIVCDTQLQEESVTLELLNVTDIFMEPLKSMVVSKRNSSALTWSDIGEQTLTSRKYISQSQLPKVTWKQIAVFNLAFVCLVLPGAVENIIFMIETDDIMSNLEIYNGSAHQLFQLMFYCHFALDGLVYVVLTDTFWETAKAIVKSS